MNPYNIVAEFEETIAEYAGSNYAIAVESCSAAIFLSLEYTQAGWSEIPRFTYPSVACAILHNRMELRFRDEDWLGYYEIKPHKIYDSALRLKRGMYKDGLHCLSFHIKKHLPIGRGGMILTNDVQAYEWLKRSRFDGRNELPLREDHIQQLGWNMYMTPEQATRGIQLFDLIKNKELPDLDWKQQGYPDLSKIYGDM